jgi:uncharacterized circularly permuted ATP-grasp superfamily protein/uncharacterized alpha-E superfamily protein
VHEVRRGEAAGKPAGHGLWREVFDPDGHARPVYRPLLDQLTGVSRAELRRREEQLEATMREMGVTFDIVRDRPWGRRPWECDLLPQIFTPEEWKPLAAGMAQRMRAFECFLRDIYHDKRILRAGHIPIPPVLGSPFYQRAAAGLPLPAGAFLHLCGLAICRLPDGSLAAKHQYFSNASGISYMMQNRRALARVLPGTFHDYDIHSIADASTSVLETLRALSLDRDPTVVLLSSGQGSAVYSEHSFLARRMGIPVVRGGDLLVLDDRVYLKTVSGLERIEVIYTRISDAWLDPLAFRKDSHLGVPGLVHCIRKGSVSVINAVGSQLADDRSLLPFTSALIRYYLGESPLLECVSTYWLGDIDQRELILENLDNYTIRPLYGERILTPPPGESLPAHQRQQILREILEHPAAFIAQPRDCDAVTVCFQGGKPASRFQDHILFALRKAEYEYEVFPGALTRVSTEDVHFTASELGGGSKDTWVLAGDDNDFAQSAARRPAEIRIPSQHVTSRVAEAFYWIGRYLERAQNLAGMIAVIETLETEELNPTERMHYRPVWNRLLPPLEGNGASKRTISNARGRYRLTLDLDERGSVVSTIIRAASNAESVLECLSLEAWSVISDLRSRFQRPRFRKSLDDAQCAAITRRLCGQAYGLVARFFGVAETTMLVDGGWRFCKIGQMIERAAITSNASLSMMRSLLRTRGDEREHAREIQLSAFLRLLSCRDLYRRVYQMRIEPGPVLEMLWQNPTVPRSVTHCIEECALHLAAPELGSSPAMLRTVNQLGALRHQILHVDWEALAEAALAPGAAPMDAAEQNLLSRLESLMTSSLDIHHTITDGFLNHQIHMGGDQPLLLGFTYAI